MATSWCRICGKTYNACPHCDPNNSWRIMCDTEAHFQVWMIVYDYKHGSRSKESAKKCLKNILSYKYITREEIDGFIPSVKEILYELLDDNDATASAEVATPAKKNRQKRKPE